MWYSSSERVCEGAITIESPVCVPRGSKFCGNGRWRVSIERKREWRGNATHLHVAANDNVVGGVTDNLVLELLPSLERLLDEDLRGEGERFGGKVTELVLVLSETGSESTEGEGGTEDDGVTDLLGGDEGVVDARDGGRGGGGNANLLESLDEEVAVLGNLKSADLGTENLDTETLQDTHLLELDTDVEGGLSTESEEDTVGALLLENVGDVFGGNGDV
jgi:hypothetical protein